MGDMRYTSFGEKYIKYKEVNMEVGSPRGRTSLHRNFRIASYLIILLIAIMFMIVTHGKILQVSFWVGMGTLFGKYILTPILSALGWVAHARG